MGRGRPPVYRDPIVIEGEIVNGPTKISQTGDWGLSLKGGLGSIPFFFEVYLPGETEMPEVGKADRVRISGLFGYLTVRDIRASVSFSLRIKGQSIEAV